MAVTAPRWYEDEQSKVGSEVEVWKPCEVVLGGTSGYLLISKQRANFVHEKGLPDKAVKCDLDYHQVGKISYSDDRVFNITEELLRERLEQMLGEDEFDSP